SRRMKVSLVTPVEMRVANELRSSTGSLGEYRVHDVEQHATGGVIVGVQAWVVDGDVHARDQAAAHQRTGEADHLARRQSAIQTPVDCWHRLVVEAVSIEVKPHPVHALGGQEGRRVICGILDADSAKLGQVTDEHRLAVDVPAAVAQLQDAIAMPVDLACPGGHEGPAPLEV